MSLLPPDPADLHYLFEKERIPMINEEKLFKLLPYFFDRPSAVLMEIAQNAHRSGATNTNVGNKFTKNVKSVLPTPRFTA
jgi:hypothetical protein